MKDLVFRAPAAAYRADLDGRDEPFGPDDDQWLVAAVELHHAARSRARGRREHLSDAIGVAVELLGDEAIEGFVKREWLGQRVYCDAAIVLANVIHYAGAPHLAAGMMDDVRRAAPDLTVLQVGRLLGRRARIDWKLDRTQEAAERYDEIAALGRRSGITELLAIAELGHVTLAQLRGDFPDFRRRISTLLPLADGSGNPALKRGARHAAMISRIRDGDIDGAVIAGWQAWELSQGFESWEAETLANLAQLLLETGHAAEARAGFAAALQRSAPAVLVLPALGGLALASSHLGQEPTVEWTVREVSRAQGYTVPQYALASAHLECAQALSRLGRTDEASSHRAIAESIARRNRFHEIVFRASELGTPPTPSQSRPLGEQAAAYASQLAALEPKHLPSEVEFEVTVV